MARWKAKENHNLSDKWSSSGNSSLDLKWEPQDIANDGNKYVVRSLVSGGTPNGRFMGSPTDGTKSFQIMSIDFHTVIDGETDFRASLGRLGYGDEAIERVTFDLF